MGVSPKGFWGSPAVLTRLHEVNRSISRAQLLVRAATYWPTVSLAIDCGYLVDGARVRKPGLERFGAMTQFGGPTDGIAELVLDDDERQTILLGPAPPSSSSLPTPM